MKVQSIAKILCLILLICFGCRERQINTGRAFYYWKTVFDGRNLHILDTLAVNRLLVRCFDIERVQEQVIPVAPIRFTEEGKKAARKYSLNPVVFITPAALAFYTDTNQVKALAIKIIDQVENIFTANDLKQGEELQIDCDWTINTRENYFVLLRTIKAEMNKRNANSRLSVTLRLHQVKYANQTGIPPADKALLMCYNMGNLKNPATVNSILDPEEMEKYLGRLDTYPLPMDIALPVFNWHVWFRQMAYKGLIKDSDVASLPFSRNRYIFSRDSTLGSYSFEAGDMIRFEDSRPEALQKALRLLEKKMPKGFSPIIHLYHFDSTLLSKYSIHELEEIFNGLHQ
jgi:hypothetical protein